MGFFSQLFVIIIIFAAVAWFARARLLAILVAWLASRQRGLKVSVESLTLGGATQIQLTLADGRSLVKDVQCRRLNISWMSASRSDMDRSPSSDGGSDREDEGAGPVGASGFNLQSILLSLSRMRVHIQLVGVRVRLRTERSAESVDSTEPTANSAVEAAKGAAAVASATLSSTPSLTPTAPAPPMEKKKKSMNLNFLLKSVLPFVSVDLHDVEVLSYSHGGSAPLLRGRKLGLHVRRSEQVFIMEHLFVCPGARGVKDDKIYHECGLVELDSACATSVMPLQDLLGALKMARRKRGHANSPRVTFDVNSLRVNVSPSYLRQLKAVFGSDTVVSSPALRPASAATRRSSPFYRICGEDAMPITLETSVSSAAVNIPHSGFAHQLDVKGVSVYCQTSPLKGGARDGRLQSSISWDNVSVTVGAEDAVAVECQSSRAESTMQIHISSSDRDAALFVDGCIHIGALHTKMHHELVGSWLEALQAFRQPSHSDTQQSKPKQKQIQVVEMHYKVNLSLGNGSSMQFVDVDNVCMLHQSLDAASISFKRDSEMAHAKLEVSGIAMAEETMDSRSEGQVKGGVQRLRQVLSGRSFSASVAVSNGGDTAFSVSVNSLAGKVSNKLMKDACMIAGSVLAAFRKPRREDVRDGGNKGSNMNVEEGTSTRPFPSSQGRRHFSVRADLLDVDLAVLSTYVVEKQQSSINSEHIIRSALAVRVKNIGLSWTTAGLFKANSETISVLFYVLHDGTSDQDFSLDFDTMEEFVYSTPLVVQRIRLEDISSRSGDEGSKTCERRVTVGPVQAYVDADALVSVVHFSKSMDAVRVATCREDRDDHSAACEGETTKTPGISKFIKKYGAIKTIAAVEELGVCIPVSSDREMSMRAVNGLIEHEDGAFSIRAVSTAVLIKGVETIVAQGLRAAVWASNNGSNDRSTVSVHADDVSFILPHDRDPGPTFKIFTLYVKACKQLLVDIKGPKPTSLMPSQPASTKKLYAKKTEINLSISNGNLIFQHHPLERWFASHSNSIRHAALVEHLWDEAHTSVMSESDAQAPLHSGKSQSEQKDTSSKPRKSLAQPKSWRNLMSRHATSHIKQLSAGNKALALYENLFEVVFQNLKLHAVSDTTPEDALAFVRSVDEPSRNVAIKSSKLFETELSGASVDVKFGGCNRPLYSGTGVVMLGKVALAKQAIARPQTCNRRVHIGMHHVKEIKVPLRGTCPPLKVFTDVLVQTETSSVFFSPGLEPVLGLLGITSKRLVPSDPESVSKKPPPVPWWDDLRYFWRGMARISSEKLNIALVPGLSPTYSKVMERLEVDSEDVSVTLESGGTSLETGLLRMLIFRKTLEESGGKLCVFPVADVKSMVANILVTWRLPNGADPMDHYLFASSGCDLDDATAIKGEDNKNDGSDIEGVNASVVEQHPVFVADVYKASALDVVIDVSFRRKSEGLDPPMLYIGGEIVSFWRKFVRDWEIPNYMKNQVRRGTFFVRKPRLPGKKKGLPKLIEGLAVKVDSEELQLTHFTLDGKDPGGGLLVGTTHGEWEFAWECNKEVRGFLSAPPNARVSVSTDLKSDIRTKTTMSHLAVVMEHVTVKSLQFSADGEVTPPSNIFKQGRLSTADSTLTSLSSDSLSESLEYDPTEAHWLAERVAIAKSMSDRPDGYGERRMEHLKVTVEDCYFMTDLELRDAIWATVEHLIAAFAPSWREPSVGPLRSATTPGVQFQRSYSRHSDLAEEEENELLSLLLRQKRAEGSSSALASPQGTVELDKHESANAETDVLPITINHDDSASEIKYEVEVSNMQLILQRDHEMGTSRGRLLLATKSATLTGATNDTHTITTLDMEDVQAYISLSSVDPSAQIVWLDIADDTKEFITPSVEERESLWRRVFNPINMTLTHSKFQSIARHMSQHQSTGSIARQGEELLLKIPEIAAVMDGREFEVLIDVVSFLITSGPTVNTCNSVMDLRRDEVDSSKVANEQMLLELSSRQLACIRSEAISILQGIPESQASSVWSTSEPLPFSGALKVSLEAPEGSGEQPSDLLRKYIEQGKDEAQHNAILLLRWSQEQEQLALEDYNMAKSRLEETSESLKRQTQVKNASRVLIHLNRVVWQLCDQERVPFVQASIRKAVFDRRRNRDRSGSVRFTIHRLDVLDATGVLPEGPATSAGVILTTWNPESSYEREPMLRVISTLGVPTSRYDVFEHLDATLHPLTLHLTEQIATSCWEYFFPREDQKSRQEAFSSSIGGKKLAPAMVPSPRKTSFTATDHASVPSFAPESSTSSPLVKQESDVSTRSEVLGTMTRVSSPSVRRRDSPIIKRKKSAIRLQKRFKYVKLNRAHMRITYAGKPIGIKDRVLVINSYACENLDGTWRDLLSNVKQKAIFSALFSGLGLQGRKVKELMIGAAPSIKSVELPKSDEDDLANNRGLLAKFGLKHNYNQAGASQRRKADDPETQKKRALFGESILHRLHRRPTSNTNSPREGGGQSFDRDHTQYPNEIIRKHAAPLRELQLDQPLPPDDRDSDSNSDSDGVDEPIDPIIGVADVINMIGSSAVSEGREEPPGPLGAGLPAGTSARSSVDTVSTSASAPAAAVAPAKYDPRAPPTWLTSSQVGTTDASRTQAEGKQVGPMEAFRSRQQQ